METRNKLGECRYFLDILPTVREDPNGFRCNLGAFLNAWRSVLDVMLYDFDEFYNLGFSREVELTEKEFRAVATALRNEEALRFIQWWRKKQGMLRNSPLWRQRIINFHRGGTNIHNYSAVVSGSGGTSYTLSTTVVTVPLPVDSTLNALVPQATIPTVTVQVVPTVTVQATADWYFADFPERTVIEICKAAYAQWEEIVQEAEREFHVQL